MSDALHQRLERIENLLRQLVKEGNHSVFTSPVLMSAKEVAEHLDMHVETVRKLHRTGQIRHARGHKNPLKFDVVEIEQFRLGRP